MCKYFSCIVTRDLKVYWSKSGPNHEAVICEAKLDDLKLEDREFVRIEIIPNNVIKVTRNKKDWTLVVDEEGTLPTWFQRERKMAESKCWLAWKESIQLQLAIGEEEREVTDTYIVAGGSSHVVARGSSHVVARGSSHVEAWDSSHVVAWDSSHVVAGGSSHVVAWDSSHVELKSQFVSVFDATTGEILVSADAKVRVTFERKVS